MRLGKYVVTLLSVICFLLILGNVTVAEKQANSKIAAATIFSQLEYAQLSEAEKDFFASVYEKEGIYYFHDLVVVSLGEKPNTGYEITYVKHEEIENSVTVFAKIREPKPDELTGEALTYPTLIAKIDLDKQYKFINVESGEEIINTDPLQETTPLTFTPINNMELPTELKTFIESVKHSEGIYQLGDFFIITAGEKPTTGYSLEFVNQEEISGQIFVNVALKKPNGKAGMAITYPYLVGRMYLPPTTTVTFLNNETESPLFGIGSPTIIFASDELDRKEEYIEERFRQLAHDKEWEISFNFPLDLDSVTSETLFISEKANGTTQSRFPTKIEIIDDRTIKVIPATSYRSGQTYRLHITTGIKSKNKGSLKEEKIVLFQVTERKATPTFDPKKSLQFQYDFSNGKQGWEGEFAEFHINEFAPYEMYQMEFSHQTVPTGHQGLYIQSMNRSDDLFMYITKQLGKKEGLKANTTYYVELNFDLATNVAPGLMGIGGAPGESVFVKAGGTAIKPKANFIDGFYYMNIFKDNQSGGGVDTAVLGVVPAKLSQPAIRKYQDF